MKVYSVMKKRVIWKMLVLTIVTLGIYRLYWFIKTRREMMDLNPSVKILSPILLLVPVILIIGSAGALIYSTIQNATNRPLGANNCNISIPRDSAINEGASPTFNDCRGAESTPPLWGIGFFYISLFFYYPLMVIWLWGYSKGVEIITGNHTTFAIALLILLLVPDGIDILIIQDGFNKLADAAPTPTSSAAPTPIAA